MTKQECTGSVYLGVWTSRGDDPEERIRDVMHHFVEMIHMRGYENDRDMIQLRTNVNVMGGARGGRSPSRPYS